MSGNGFVSLRALMTGDRVRILPVGMAPHVGESATVTGFNTGSLPIDVRVDQREHECSYSRHELRPLVRVRAGSRRLTEQAFRWTYGAMAIRLLDGVSA